MKYLITIWAIGVAFISSGASAGETEVRNMLQRSFPQATVSSILKTPIPGVVESVVDGQIYYVTADGRYVLGGPLIDTKTNENLTQAHLDRINAIPFSTLPLTDAIKRVKGDGSRKIAIFEDPDCPYCKRLENEISGIDNLTIYVFLYPIEQLHPGAPDKSKAIWCAADRGKAWENALHTGLAPTPTKPCATPIERNIALAHKYKINGTPTIILENGVRVVGAVSREKLEALLIKAKTK